jgi:hypothetical protein
MLIYIYSLTKQAGDIYMIELINYMKRRSLVRIFPALSCVDRSKKKKKTKFASADLADQLECIGIRMTSSQEGQCN